MSTTLNDAYRSMRSLTRHSFDMHVRAHAALAPSKNFYLDLFLYYFQDCFLSSFFPAYLFICTKISDFRNYAKGGIIMGLLRNSYMRYFCIVRTTLRHDT